MNTIKIYVKNKLLYNQIIFFKKAGKRYPIRAFDLNLSSSYLKQPNKNTMFKYPNFVSLFSPISPLRL